MNEVPSELTVAVHMEGGSYWAEVVELPGCFAAGDTFGELQESLQEAIELYLDIKVGSELRVSTTFEHLMEARGVAERYRDNEYARDWWESHTILPRTADYVLPWETEFVPKLDAQGRPWFR